MKPKTIRLVEKEIEPQFDRIMSVSGVPGKTLALSCFYRNDDYLDGQTTMGLILSAAQVRRLARFLAAWEKAQ